MRVSLIKAGTPLSLILGEVKDFDFEADTSAEGKGSEQLLRRSPRYEL